MSIAPKKKSSNPQRFGLYAKINIGKGELGWDDDQYREWLENTFQKTSLKQLTFAELETALQGLKDFGFKVKRPKTPPKRAGRSKLAAGDTQRKVRALWISLYHLGAVENPSEQALEGYAKRICLGKKGNETVVFPLQALTDQQAFKVIESLKKWAEREGVSWEGYRYIGPQGPYTVYNPRARVLEAQWNKISDKNLAALGSYATKFSNSDCLISHTMLNVGDADRLIEQFGKQIRSEPKNIIKMDIH